MAFIGIICENKNAMQIKRVLEQNINCHKKEYTVIIINDKSVENIKNIRFETILVIDIEGIQNKEILNELFKNTKYLVINSDMQDKDLELINNVKSNVITFGFNQKSTVTTSSVEENLMLCVQRKLVSIDKHIIEPQEIEVKISNEKLLNNAHNAMGIATILLIYGKKEIFF